MRNLVYHFLLINRRGDKEILENTAVSELQSCACQGQGSGFGENAAGTRSVYILSHFAHAAYPSTTK